MALVQPVWEWATDRHVWSEYDPQTAQLLESAWLRGDGSVEIDLSPGSGPSHDIHFKTATAWQINCLTGTARELRRVTSPQTPAATWEWWKFEDNSWHSYDAHISPIVEQSWQQADSSKLRNEALGLAAVHLTLNRSLYAIWFNTEGTQTSRATGFKRGVRRRHGPPAVRQQFSATQGQAFAVLANQGAGGGSSSAAPGTFQLRDSAAPSSLASAPLLRFDAAECFLALPSPPEDATCAICCSELCDEAMAAVRLSRCPHQFHRECIEAWFLRRPSCPECVQHYGRIMGTQPIEGASMVVQYHTYDRHMWALDGHPNEGVIEIIYTFQNGIQGPEHPRPGVPYTGTRRVAFLPWSPGGEEVLALLRVAWQRRLVFKIGQSITTGIDNTIVWNGIHHKTNRGYGPAYFGYPDETYFPRVKGELADLGVV